MADIVVTNYAVSNFSNQPKREYGISRRRELYQPKPHSHGDDPCEPNAHGGEARKKCSHQSGDCSGSSQSRYVTMWLHDHVSERCGDSPSQIENGVDDSSPCIFKNASCQPQ